MRLLIGFLAATLIIGLATDQHPTRIGRAAVRPDPGPDRCETSLYRCRQGWHKRGRIIREQNRRIANLDRVARHGVSYPELIRLAAIAYRYPASVLERKARCESVNYTDFYNERSGASNVFQFLRSTWASTPYAGFSIFDPFAAVLAGAWMHHVGRGGEWVCQ